MKSRNSSPQTSPQIVRRYRVESITDAAAGTNGTFVKEHLNADAGFFVSGRIGKQIPARASQQTTL